MDGCAGEIAPALGLEDEAAMVWASSVERAARRRERLIYQKSVFDGMGMVFWNIDDDVILQTSGKARVYFRRRALNSSALFAGHSAALALHPPSLLLHGISPNTSLFVMASLCPRLLPP